MTRAIPLRSLMRFTGGGLIDHCYRELLRREADPTGRAHYRARLAAGHSHLAIVREIAGSREARRQGVRVQGLWLFALLATLERLPLIGRLSRLLSARYTASPFGLLHAIRPWPENPVFLRLPVPSTEAAMLTHQQIRQTPGLRRLELWWAVLPRPVQEELGKLPNAVLLDAMFCADVPGAASLSDCPVLFYLLRDQWEQCRHKQAQPAHTVEEIQQQVLWPRARLLSHYALNRSPQARFDKALMRLLRKVQIDTPQGRYMLRHLLGAGGELLEAVLGCGAPEPAAMRMGVLLGALYPRHLTLVQVKQILRQPRSWDEAFWLRVVTLAQLRRTVYPHIFRQEALVPGQLLQAVPSGHTQSADPAPGPTHGYEQRVALFNLGIPRIPFPSPRWPGNAAIRPLTDSWQLGYEGAAMRHCVMQFQEWILSGDLAVYRMLWPQRCTVLLHNNPPSLKDIRLFQDALPADATVAFLNSSLSENRADWPSGAGDEDGSACPLSACHFPASLEEWLAAPESAMRGSEVAACVSAKELGYVSGG